MDILGIGVPELLFILIIALIVLGPKDMQKAGKTVGSWMRKFVMSDEWKGIKNASRRLKTLPNELMREASLDELSTEYEKFRKLNDKELIPDEQYGAWGGKPTPDNRIAPSPGKKPASIQKTDTQPESDTANATLTDSDNA
jgi:sec-independent protein translocase protein TatB